MSDQSPLNRAIRLVTALVLLAAVMTSPIRSALTALASGRSRADCLRCNFDMPSKANTTHNRPHTPVNSRVVQVKALSSHHELDLASDSVRHRVEPTDAAPPFVGWQSPILEVEQTVHPLRC
jgi:hypothetical protein